MSYAYSIDPDARTALLAFEYAITADEVVRACSRLYGDARWAPGFHIIVDLRRVTEMRLQQEELQAIVEQDRALADRVGSGLDVVLVSRTTPEALAQYYADRAAEGPRRVYVARDREEARRLIATHRHQEEA